MVTSGFRTAAIADSRQKMGSRDGPKTTGNHDGEEDNWRQHIRQKMEEELERRVREALDTPPLERQRRAREQAQRSRVDDCEEMNAHLDLVEKDRDSSSAIRQRMRLAHSREIDSRLHFQRVIEPVTLPNLLQQFPGDYYESTSALFEKLQSGRSEERNGYFIDPDELTYEDDELTAARGGISLPSGVRLLVPPPEFILSVPPVPEPLAAGQDGPDLFDSQCTPYTHKWRGICIVFDSEKWPKDQQPIPIGNPLVAPNLTFESRFETGNLRQARRVGQFEYELLLKTDLYTKRHTQWYYFRVQNMVPSVTYKFRIVNFLKKDSLYNYGMKPLFYSELDAKTRNVGWVRKGHHIRYGMNMEHLASPLLSRDLVYYELEWQTEFTSAGDTCYLAHCYPYTFTDLKADLDAIMADPKRNGVTKREVMCETRAGNSCFLLTVTNFDVKTMKRCIVVSARVHPGETNSSWMMKGLLDFITGPDWRAEELRRKFVFKIVPMLNPDGVIIGNYRCGLAGKDLNRNYRHPRHESFPTVASTKSMVLQMQSKMEVLIYCDLHGHSRKSNVFMYGCNSPESMAGDVRAFLDERIFPFLVAKNAPEAFSFSACKFQIKKCKESTGRVVMYRQMKIKNSFTLEATFSGTIIDKTGSRHFNQRDFQDIGKVFCLGVHEYSRTLEDKQKETEVVLDLAKEIAHQILKLKGFQEARNENEGEPEAAAASSQPDTHAASAGAAEAQAADSSGGGGQPAAIDGSGSSFRQAASAGAGAAADDRSSDMQLVQPQTASRDGAAAAAASERCEPATPATASVEAASAAATATAAATAAELLPRRGGGGGGTDDRLRMLASLDSLSESTVQECLGLLGQLRFDLDKLESDSSSDSDSESDPEAKAAKQKAKKSKKRSKKRKAKKKVRSRSSSSNRSKAIDGQTPVQTLWEAAVPASSSSAPPTEPISRPFVLPTIGSSAAADKDNRLSAQQDREVQQKAAEKYVKSHQWTNPYAGRSNGGIPCFSEERSLERAAKRISEMRKKSGEFGQQQQQPPPPYPAATIVWHDGRPLVSGADERPAFGVAASGDGGGGSGDIDDDYYQQWLSYHFERERTQELLRWSLQTLADSYAGPLPKVTYQHADVDADIPHRHAAAVSTRATAQEHGFYARVLPPPTALRPSGGSSQSCYTYADWIDPLACSLITLSALHSPYGAGSGVDRLALLPAEDGTCHVGGTATLAAGHGGSGLSLAVRAAAHSQAANAHASTDVLSTVGLRRPAANQPASGAQTSGQGSTATSMPLRKPSWRLKYAGAAAAAASGAALLQQQSSGKPPTAAGAAAATPASQAVHGSRLLNGGGSRLGAAHLLPLSMSESAIHAHPALRGPVATTAAAAGSLPEQPFQRLDVGYGLPPVPQSSKQPTKLMSRDYTELLGQRLKQQQQMLTAQADAAATKGERLRAWSRQT